MYNRGFTIFFAVLVSSLALAVGLSIYDILVRELQLSQTGAQTQYAIYAADTGAECALYWDFEYSKVNASDLDGSVFATSSNTTEGLPVSGSNINCDNPTGAQDISTNWTVTKTATAATTTFTIYLNGVATNACAVVTVAKNTPIVTNPPQTAIVAHGYNTCSTNITRLERVLQVNY